MRMHISAHVYNQINKIKQEKPKAMLHFLESMTVEEFRHFFSLIEQWDFFQTYHMKEMYRPLETIDSYRKQREREREQLEREQLEREQLEREQREQRKQQELQQRQIYEREREQHNLREQLQKMQMFQQNILSSMFQQAIPSMFPQFMNPVGLPSQVPLLPAPIPFMPAPAPTPSIPLAPSVTIDRSRQYVSRWDSEREGNRGRDRSRSRERPVRSDYVRYY